jgi:chromosome segregation ATPase
MSNRNPGNKKSLKSTKNTVESHSSRLEQVKTDFSGLTNKINTYETTEESLDNRLKSCERSTQEVCDSIKRPNLLIMGIKEGKGMQTKGICNIFNKIITENLPSLKEELSIQVQKNLQDIKQAFHGQIRAFPWHIIIKKTIIDNRERISKALKRKKKQHIKAKPSK